MAAWEGLTTKASVWEGRPMQEAEESLSWEVYWPLTLDCFRRCHSGSGRPLLGGDTEPARGTHHLQEATTTRATSASVLELSAR